jgi:hypothetical protein
LLPSFFVVFLFSSSAEPANLIVVGDTRLQPVVDIISGIKETLKVPVKAYFPADVKGRLSNIAAQEDVRVVIALGRDAIDEALQLPSSIAVIYDLVVTPPPVNRPNTTGFYMGTPVKEYVALIRAYLHSIRRIAVIGSPGTLSVLEGAGEPQVASYSVKNSYELVNTINRLEAVDAIVLLPDVSLLTAAAMDEAYLISFKRGIPLIGLSGKQVKQGALLALVFDPVHVGRHIGEKASNVISGTDIGKVRPSPPDKFELYINMDTARKMDITIPAELVKRAKKVYP